MMDQWFRLRLPKLVAPAVNHLVSKRVHPTALTALAVVTSVFAAFSVAYQLFALAFVLWWVSRFLDGIDGAVARKRNLSTPFGAYADILGDALAYGAMILGFREVFVEFSSLFGWVLFLYLLCMTSTLALGQIRAERLPKGMASRGLELASGIAEGAETSVYYSVLLVWPEYGKTATLIWIAVLSITVLARTAMALRVER